MGFLLSEEAYALPSIAASASPARLVRRLDGTPGDPEMFRDRQDNRGR
jgi:hypothetical protein